MYAHAHPLLNYWLRLPFRVVLLPCPELTGRASAATNVSALGGSKSDKGTAPRKRHAKRLGSTYRSVKILDGSDDESVVSSIVSNVVHADDPCDAEVALDERRPASPLMVACSVSKRPASSLDSTNSEDQLEPKNEGFPDPVKVYVQIPSRAAGHNDELDTLVLSVTLTGVTSARMVWDSIISQVVEQLRDKGRAIPAAMESSVHDGVQIRFLVNLKVSENMRKLILILVIMLLM